MLINKNDNVEVNPRNGHKYAVCRINKGENVIKYGFPIGYALTDIEKGEHIHTHNLRTNLSGKIEYKFNGAAEYKPVPDERTFMGYRRKNGRVGIRNDVWIVTTVGCINKSAQRIAEKTGAKYFPHPFGCSQLGCDMEITQKILCGMVNHPNAGGVLVLGLGCENNNIGAFKRVLKVWDEERIKFLNAQEVEDEISEGIAIVRALQKKTDSDKRTEIPFSELKIGLKCGGSDGLSGITANPLVGRFCDHHTSAGGICILTEVPEMFGAEQILMNRCVSKNIFDKTVMMINDFKDYFMRHGQEIYENPSPGNKEGGITTLEEKSLGCVQKGGTSAVTDVLGYGDTAEKSGLNLLTGPGNDMVAVTNLMAAGANIILFTTGRGTPLGTAVPTIKISTGSELAAKKKSWIDFDAGKCLSGEPLTDELTALVKETAEGKLTQNEKNGYEEISIFKDGVVL